MNRNRWQYLKLILILLSVIVFWGCMMKGYQVDLKIRNARRAIDPIKVLLTGEGFVRVETSSLHQSQKQETLERYRKEPQGSEKHSSGKKPDYSVVDIIYTVGDITDIEVHIYNINVGNNPKVKPTLLGTANRIEKMIRDTIPEVKIIRSEGLAGVPFI